MSPQTGDTDFPYLSVGQLPAQQLLPPPQPLLLPPPQLLLDPESQLPDQPPSLLLAPLDQLVLAELQLLEREPVPRRRFRARASSRARLFAAIRARLSGRPAGSETC
ncbi:hypothetical protein [Nocardia alba]|uniref:hypothetical protein n=1 Tax=Nocardia alba TaxID=225051 RepID=UPI00082C5E8C|nr:hypothetical protein [Nocardia alba]